MGPDASTGAQPLPALGRGPLACRTRSDTWEGQMNQQSWRHRPPPVPDAGAPHIWSGEPATAAELTAGRAQLRTTVTGSAHLGDEDLDRLLLVFEELASNGLCHGSPPVHVTVTSTAGGWLLQVSDAAVDRPPIPPVGRDPAAGGLG